MINAKIAVYDGEPPCKLVFGGIEIEIGLTPLKAIVDCARMDLREASGPTRRMLEFPLFVLQQAVDMVTTLSPSLSAEDNEANRKRWEETGIGGATDVSAIEDAVEKWRKRLKENRIGSTEDFNKTKQSFDGCL